MQQLTNLPLNGQGIVQVQMTVQEYLKLINEPHQRELRRGLDGIMDIFHCSRSTACRIAHSDWFRPAIAQTGRIIIFDANKAWELAKSQTLK